MTKLQFLSYIPTAEIHWVGNKGWKRLSKNQEYSSSTPTCSFLSDFLIVSIYALDYFLWYLNGSFTRARSPGLIGMERKLTFIPAPKPCSSFHPQELFSKSYPRVRTHTLGSQSQKLSFLLFLGPQQGHGHSPRIPIRARLWNVEATWLVFSNQPMFLSLAPLLSRISCLLPLVFSTSEGTVSGLMEWPTENSEEAFRQTADYKTPLNS